MRWLKWLMPAIALVILVAGITLNIPQKFQASTGWIGFFVFMAAFFVLLGVEKLIDDAT